ncbi:hypothetical protein ACXWPL_09545, partial [Streptococcus pyogenes]
SGNLNLRELTVQLNDAGDDSVKYETIELCYDVLSAGGKSSSDQARIVELVARAINFDLSELEKIRDSRIVKLNADLGEGGQVERLLG